MKKQHFFYFIFISILFINGVEVYSHTNDTLPVNNSNTIQNQNSSIFIDDNCQSIMKIKKDFISKNLKLTEKESQQFWPIYNTYLKQEAIIYDQYKIELEKKGIKSQKGKIIPSISTDDQILFYLDMYYQTREATTLLEQKLYLDLKKVLTPRNLLYFLDLEKSFKSRVKEKAQGACPRSNK
ncbi:MAG: hypothetical protein CVU02_03065 [Bacteroidetes bacterium HGW-Bacteroidetes-19]|nr:MAG: hypothetical protein CVU04_06045 [Bacteroidetes bacterium HGW-Bacteroidetes-20]PKP27607.1 MAG: hypothetical protein CVU02_03065 [Bacteroidetes bacterium HGW-Bacteroidetes-19]